MSNPTCDHFLMSDQHNRTLVFFTDGRTYGREWLNAPPNTPPRLIRKEVSMMVYACAWLSFCKQGGLSGHITQTHTEDNDFNPAQLDLDRFFNDCPPDRAKAA